MSVHCQSGKVGTRFRLRSPASNSHLATRAGKLHSGHSATLLHRDVVHALGQCGACRVTTPMSTHPCPSIFYLFIYFGPASALFRGTLQLLPPPMGSSWTNRGDSSTGSLTWQQHGDDRSVASKQPLAQLGHGNYSDNPADGRCVGIDWRRVARQFRVVHDDGDAAGCRASRISRFQPGS